MVKDTENIKIAIVASKFNSLIVDRLYNGAITVFKKNGINEKKIKVVRVPGAFEIPVTVKKLLNLEKFDAIVTLGAVIRGETPHFEFIANECAAGIARLSIASSTPIIFGVLTVDNKEQAMKRSEEEGNNKGVDAAEAALEMIELFQDI